LPTISQELGNNVKHDLRIEAHEAVRGGIVAVGLVQLQIICVVLRKCFGKLYKPYRCTAGPEGPCNTVRISFAV